jgi:hypothetical protein
MQSHHNCNPKPAIGVTGSLKSDCTIRMFYFSRLERQWGGSETDDRSNWLLFSIQVWRGQTDDAEKMWTGHPRKTDGRNSATDSIYSARYSASCTAQQYMDESFLFISKQICVEGNMTGRGKWPLPWWGRSCKRDGETFSTTQSPQLSSPTSMLEGILRCSQV